MGHFWLKWVGQLWLNKLLFLGDRLKTTGLQGSSLSNYHMTTGFGPFKTLTLYFVPFMKCHV